MLPQINRRSRVAIGAGSLVLVAAGLVGSVGGSLAYFSDSQAGTLSGSVGSIKGSVNTSTLAFTNLLPGEVQTVQAKATNTGLNNQDVWVVFDNADALHALNNLGTYGEFHITAEGSAKFDSANLNDRSSTCGAFNPAGCWPVPQKVKLASNVPPTGTVTYEFGFGYAGKLQGQTSEGGGAWNAYPLGAPTSSGLPYKIVETQVGQQP
ncbi:hypothetical protein [Terrabacter sp. 2YAF2]|uniref:hypothetical protein n=1 Tax=Terrabacter sp. 2YAF2 TaxID=3233026 RepID=UPI003F9B2ACE